MNQLENQIKSIARESGANLVGIASKQRLYDAPPSGNPDYLLPSTQSIISFAVTLDKSIARDFISKKNWLSHCEERKRMARSLYGISDRLVDFLKSEGFEALGVDINNSYRPEPGAKDVTEMSEFIPGFSHRYGAVAAGIGRQGPPEQQAPAKQKATPELINQLKNRDSSIRRSAAEKIGIMGDEKAVDSLIAVLKDDNRFVRQEAVRALGKIGGARALESLTQALVEEKDEFVKDSIKKAMERLQPK